MIIYKLPRPSGTPSKFEGDFSPFTFLLFSFLLFAPFSASAQRFIGGIAAGFNLTQVDGDEVFGYHKFGINGGPYIKLMLDKKQRFSLTMELLYTQKGAEKRFPVPEGILFAKDDTLLIDPQYPDYDKKFFYKLHTDYLEIPILVHFEDPRSKFGFGLGVSWSRLVTIMEQAWDSSKPDSMSGSRRLTTSVSSGRYNKNDWSFIADVKIPIYKALKFNIRFQYSLAPFGKMRKFYSETDWEKRWPFHNVLTFRIIYSFNEKYIENTNYNWDGSRIGPKWIRDPEAMKW